MARKKTYRVADPVLVALPRDPYINTPGQVRPGVVVRVDSDGVYIQADLAPGDDARPDVTHIGFFGTLATAETQGQPGTFWQKVGA